MFDALNHCATATPNATFKVMKDALISYTPSEEVAKAMLVIVCADETSAVHRRGRGGGGKVGIVYPGPHLLGARFNTPHTLFRSYHNLFIFIFKPLISPLHLHNPYK